MAQENCCRCSSRSATSTAATWAWCAPATSAWCGRASATPPSSGNRTARHHWPRGGGDVLPATKTGLAVALADRLDTLTGIFAIGQKPSGTKDPFALRRAAIGLLRMMIEKRLLLNLAALIDSSLHAHTVFEAPP